MYSTAGTRAKEYLSISPYCRDNTRKTIKASQASVHTIFEIGQSISRLPFGGQTPTESAPSITQVSRDNATLQMNAKQLKASDQDLQEKIPALVVVSTKRARPRL